MAGDLRRNGGMPSTVDTPPSAWARTSPPRRAKVVHRTEVFELIQYAAHTETVAARPLVAISPQINKCCITDMAPGRSLIEHMVERFDYQGAGGAPGSYRFSPAVEFTHSHI
jgi:polyhydroxyalkanoate synthase subunit PhaC